MDNNTGSFGSAIGGAEAIKQAMARRGIDASVLQQKSPAAAGSEPMPQAPQMGAQGAGMGEMPQVPGMPTEGATPQTAESELIIKALAARLKALGELGM